MPIVIVENNIRGQEMNAFRFNTIGDFREMLEVLPVPDPQAIEEAALRNSTLTKPAGALGCLEDIAAWYAGWQGTHTPGIETPCVIVFAGNHGVTVHGVSAYPMDVTAQMVENFRSGGAAINQLCGEAGAEMFVFPLQLDVPTADFTSQPAMTMEDFVEALSTGWNSVKAACDTLVVGEMGIGNTTAAAAVAAALFDRDPKTWVGRGTGIDEAGITVKRTVVADGLNNHLDYLDDPFEALRRLGGREMAAMAGAIARARIESIPVILDGFICTAAAAVLEKAKPGALDHCIAGHLSAEAAHGRLLDSIGKHPLLRLGLRLGEGTGGALAIPVVRAALRCHSGMATFEEAQVSGRTK